MKIYRVTYDSQDRFVEALNYGHAVTAWRTHLLDEWKTTGDYDEGDEDIEPESVELVNDEAVIRDEGCPFLVWVVANRPFAEKCVSDADPETGPDGGFWLEKGAAELVAKERCEEFGEGTFKTFAAHLVILKSLPLKSQMGQ